MLDILRANQRSVIIYVFFGMIIVVFVVFFGPQSQGCGDGGVAYAARVNGELWSEGNSGTIMWGNTTISRKGRTGKLSIVPGAIVPRFSLVICSSLRVIATIRTCRGEATPAPRLI